MPIPRANLVPSKSIMLISIPAWNCYNICVRTRGLHLYEKRQVVNPAKFWISGEPTVTPARRLIENQRGWAHHLRRCKARQARTPNLASIVNITSYIHQTTEFAWETSSRGVIKSSVLLLFVFDVTKYYLMLVTKRSRLVNNRSRKIKRPFGSDDRIQQQNNHLSFLPPSLSS